MSDLEGRLTAVFNGEGAKAAAPAMRVAKMASFILICICKQERQKRSVSIPLTRK
jgi:hypothetical protein